MDSDEICQKVREYIRTQFYVPDESVLTDDASLLGSGIIDSTGVLEVIFLLEETFGIHVEDNETTPANLDSIGAIARFVIRKREGTRSLSNSA